MASRTVRSMSKAQIASHLADTFDFTKKTGAGVLEEIAKLAYKEARKGFTLPGIGKLVVVKRKARKGRNPQTGEEVVDRRQGDWQPAYGLRIFTDETIANENARAGGNRRITTTTNGADKPRSLRFANFHG